MTRTTAYVRRLRVFGARQLGQAAERLAPDPTLDGLRARVGGLWDVIGQLQLDYLVASGLQPEDTLLEVGCGVMRAGRHFVRYLEPDRYCGIDIAPEMIAGAREQLAEDGLADRGARLRVTDGFDVDFGVPFRFGIANSVFTHLPLNSIWRCLANVGEVLEVGGTFHATFFPGPDGRERLVPIDQPCQPGRVNVRTFADRNPYHYSVEDFERLCENLPLDVAYRGEWGHPRGQQMLTFTRS